MELWQITIATAVRAPLVADGATLRAVRAIARAINGRLVLFCVVDDHLHLVVAGDRRTAGRLATRAQLALRPLLVAATDPAHISAVNNRAHLVDLVAYFARQTVKHGLIGHPATWPGSCLADLVGVRNTPGFDPAALRMLLPRLTIDAMLRCVQLDRASIEPADEDELHAVGPSAIVESACAALGAAIGESSMLGVLARATAARILHRLGFPAPSIARHLGVSERTARRLRRKAVPSDIRELVLKRIHFDAAVHAAPSVTPSERERATLARSTFR